MKRVDIPGQTIITDPQSIHLFYSFNVHLEDRIAAEMTSVKERKLELESGKIKKAKTGMCTHSRESFPRARYLHLDIECDKNIEHLDTPSITIYDNLDMSYLFEMYGVKKAKELEGKLIKFLMGNEAEKGKEPCLYIAAVSPVVNGSKK